MDDIVAIIITVEGGQDFALLTWGRVFGPVEYEELLAAVLPHVGTFGISGSEVLGRAASSLQEVATAPYFYECLFSMILERTRAPVDDTGAIRWAEWAESRRRLIEDGKSIYFAGNLHPTAVRPT